ncbi:MAG TPA: hypothetical protein VE914_15045 [Candidatus Angelobacter sp.]|nr:hypothetical protein [Candidatus Angelobacter sp.]
MAKRPNYGQERAERQRRKSARRDERLAAKAERREKGRPPGEEPEDGAEAAPASPAATMPADAAAMHRLGQALAFVCGPEHAATVAVQRAVASGGAEDIERARAMFLQLGPRDQRAALAIAAAAAPSLA